MKRLQFWTGTYLGGFLTVVPDSRNGFVDALRALAAIWVVLFHLAEGQHIPAVLLSVPEGIRYVLFDKGHLGVAIFFVLSGYVMAMTQAAPVTHLRQSGNFVLRRILRLWPPYALAIALTVASLAVKLKIDANAVPLPTLGEVAVNSIFMQDLLGFRQINTVFWTLCVEVQFYIAFAFFLYVIDRCGLHRFWSFLAVFLLVALWPMGFVSASVPGLFVPYFYSFLLGVLVFFGTRTRHAAYAIYGGIGVSITISLVSSVRAGESFALASSATALILLFTSTSLAKALTYSGPVFRVLRFLGAISYSLYLLHNLSIGLSFRLVKSVLGTSLFAQSLGAFFAILVAVGIAWLSYRLVERPAIAWSRRNK